MSICSGPGSRPRRDGPGPEPGDPRSRKKLGDGEIAFRGINAFKGYYGDDQATSAVMDAEGWVKTGDLGDIDENGALTITDRVDSVGQFSTGAMFVPHRIEAALKSLETMLYY